LPFEMEDGGLCAELGETSSNNKVQSTVGHIGTLIGLESVCSPFNFWFAWSRIKEEF